MMSAQGYTTEEIASRLFRTVDTMKYHRKKLLTSSTLLWLGRANELTLLSLCAASRKLGVESISEALATVMSSNVM